jgi:hypothetical protein
MTVIFIQVFAKIRGKEIMKTEREIRNFGCPILSTGMEKVSQQALPQEHQALLLAIMWMQRLQFCR